ncbi:cytidylate kinase-like family protein [Sunxiuqinia sp. A32]|uniref:cytidylate kinase-like family protein n=1 Tax=Sunxiuqinia sp. A32 TaxID=3461496 RepID=UPI0040456C73
MENSLLNYMNKRLGQTQSSASRGRNTAGPVVTISREVGCGGLKIAKKLAKSLNEYLLCKKWQVISKEVLAKSARELELDPQKVSRLFTSNERFTFDEILAAFSDKKYKSDRVIRKGVKEVVRTFAVSGCCIIVGRAAHIIANDIEQSLHIKLTAPLDWRVDKIAFNHQISKEEALKYIEKTELERYNFRKHFMKDKHVAEEFDLIINASKMDSTKIVKLIRTALELKGIGAYQPGKLSSV